MFYAMKAALRLDQHRISLQSQHKSLLADRAKSSGQTPPAEFFERIESLRLALRQSMMESIMTSRTLTKRMNVLNLGSMADTSVAEGRLTKIRSEVTKTLNGLECVILSDGT